MSNVIIQNQPVLTPSQYRLQNEVSLQLDFIENSCYLYDTGCDEEALRIAPAIAAIFFGDMRLNKLSLIYRLMSYDSPFLKVLTTNSFRPNITAAYQDKSAFLLLLGEIIDGCFQPYVDHPNTQPPSDNLWLFRWLNQPIIYFHYQHKFHVYTREDVIRLACGKLIPTLLPDRLRDDFFLRRPHASVIKLGKRRITLMNIFTASLRQMGHELLNSQALRHLTTTPVLH